MASDSISKRHGKKTESPAEAGEYTTPLSGMAARSREAADQAAGFASQGVGRIRGYTQDMTRGREGTMVITALAAGFGLGVALGLAMASTRRRPARWTDRLMAQGLGRRVMERLDERLPQAFTDCMRK